MAIIKLSKKIKRSENLDLLPPKTVVHTDQDREITWIIDPTRNFDSFRIKGKRGVNPFDTPIPDTFDTHLTLKVQGSPKLNWYYEIDWCDSCGTHHHDPKIPINPPKSDLVAFLIAILGGLFGFLSLGMLIKKLRK
jgi:hypothetical protein